MAREFTRRDLGRRLFAPVSNALEAGLGGAARSNAPRRSVGPVSKDRHLANRATFGPNDRVMSQIGQLGRESWVEWQLSHLEIDDSALASSFSTQSFSNYKALARAELIYYCLHSDRQLAWRMTYFLNNHFNTDIALTQGVAESKELHALHRWCFDRFDDVLLVSAKSPAMIDYLDSVTNIGGNPNENYARELMELHTLGVNGGYSEADVAEAARIFTGWGRRYAPNTSGFGSKDCSFRFRSNLHDFGPKNLQTLGFSTPGFSGPAGVAEGEWLLLFLAQHPNTAARFVDKLCKFFVSDQPPPGLVNRALTAFNQARSLRDTVRSIFLDPEFYNEDLIREKTLSGFEYALSAVRRLEIKNPSAHSLQAECEKLGERPHGMSDPTGYPEEGTAWQGAGHALSRWLFAEEISHNQIPQVIPDWEGLISKGLLDSYTDLLDFLLETLVDGDVTASTYGALSSFIAARYASLPASPQYSHYMPHVRDLTGLILSLPEAFAH